MKLTFSETIEQSMERAKKLAQGTSVHPLHLLQALIEQPNSICSKQLSAYRGKISQKIKELQEKDDLDSSLIKDWINDAKSEALKNNRSVVEESDLIKNLGNYFKVTLSTQSADYRSLTADDDQKRPQGLDDLHKNIGTVVESPVMLRQVVEFLNRADKNNVVLFGEKGVGKTSLIKSLAQKISEKEVPSFLQNKTLFSLNVPELTLNIHNPREVSMKTVEVLEFIKAKAEDRILFIPHFESVIKNSLIYENLKHYILNHSLNVIIEMNFDSFDSLKKDLQLMSQFNALLVKEPSIEEAISIIEKIAPVYEMKQGVFIPVEAISSLVEICAKQISGQYLPEKAIDVLDQACSSLVLKLQMASSEEATMESKIKSLKITEKYSQDKSQTSEISRLELELENLKKLRQENVQRVKQNSVLMNEISEIEKTNEGTEKLADLKKQAEENKLFTTLSKMDICEVVSQITDIPKEKIAQSKQDHVLKMGENLTKRVYGQDHAVKKISDVLMSSYAGLSSENKPLGSFLLLGPSGVGKTEIAKALTELLFDHEKYMIRLDLSEYSEKHSVSKLIGAPAGYAGYDEGGVLTEAVRKNPYSIVLFDEVEKAHQDFADILLQILDDGRLTDNKGRTVSFSNTIIFLTSNIKDPTTYFKPEVLGRFGEVITFNPLAKEVMPKIIAKELKTLNKKLAKQELSVELTAGLISHMGEKGYSEKYGARPLIRLFSQMVTKPLAQQILSGTLKKGKVEVDLAGEDSVFKNK